MPAGHGLVEGIGVDISASQGDSALEREAKIWLAKPKLTAELEKRYTHRPFTYKTFHRVPAINVLQQQDNLFEEVKRVTIQHSSVFPQGEVQLAIRLGNEYLVVDWDYAMTLGEEAELRDRQIQDRRWSWRRGSFVEPH